VVGIDTSSTLTSFVVRQEVLSTLFLLYRVYIHKWLELNSLNFQIPLHKAGKQTRCSQKALSRHNDSTPTNSTSSVMSDGK
jgi:hypothetical protein